MDNKQVATNGTGLAARILGMKTPEMQSFLKYLAKKGTIANFLKDEF
ncbi:MAG: hypothetical protein AB7U52_00205 [Candidatus Izemoplasmatales bacterium]|jgi:hypothetical protein